MRIVFAGSPALAVPTLEALNREHEVVGVLTMPPAPKGRKRILTPTPVAVAAEKLGLPVVCSAAPGADIAEQLAQWDAQLGVVLAYGALLKQPMLDAPRHGWINLHFSALPAFRGATPLQRSMQAGHTTAAMSVFQLVPALDAGDLYRVAEVPLGADETAGEALERLAQLGITPVLQAIEDIATGRQPTPQRGTPSYAPKFARGEGELALDRPRAEVYAHFRAVTPEPGAFIQTSNGRLKILAMRPVDAAPGASGELRAEAGLPILSARDGSFALLRVQPAGKQAMDARDWWRGRPAGSGTSDGALA